MSNITLDTTNFSEQLGIFDFFNVLISGAIFLLGLSIINEEIGSSLWGEVTIPKGLGLVLLIYVIGIVLQEIASFLDNKTLKIYSGMSRSILKKEIDVKYKFISHEPIIKSEILRKQYRKSAESLFEEDYDIRECMFDDEEVNRFIFSRCQYYVAVCGKDKKIEKMRALYDMSKNLMVCFALLTIYNLHAWLHNIEISCSMRNVLGFPLSCCDRCIDRLILSFVLGGITWLFFYRSQKVMRRFLLILMGTYDAIFRIKRRDRET